MQITVGGLGGVTIVALALGVVADRLSPRGSAFAVAAGVTITVALVGGFVAGPFLHRHATGTRHDHDVESSPEPFPRR
jgi:MFS family permease